MGTRLPAGWRLCTVDDVKADSKSAIAIGPFGSRMKTDCYVERGIPIIRGNNISDTKALNGEFVFISEEKAKEFSVCNVYDGDLVFPHRGLIGEVGIVTGGPKAHYVLSTSLMKLTANKNIADPLFLFYFFRSPLGRHELLKNASQVGTPGIATPLASLRSVRVAIPPLSEQRAIAKVLGTLDDKIELNRRMNETLEATAWAIFKSWFVDFDPVLAKAEGRQPFVMDAETAALFPDSFEDSSLSKIPKGWATSSLGELIELSYGKALKEEARRPGNVPVYGSNGQVGWHDEALVRGPGIVVGRKGNPGFVTWVHTDFFPIDTAFYVVRSGKVRSLHYLFHALSRAGLPSLGADSAVPGLNRNIAYMTEILAPTGEVLAVFDRTCDTLVKRVEANIHESNTLATVRDALLPKLISGEIRVKDAETLLDSAN